MRAATPPRRGDATAMPTTGFVTVIMSCLLAAASAAGAQLAAPIITVSAAPTGARNGAQLVSLAAAAIGGTIYYTTDGSRPTFHSPQYFSPFLVASNLTVKAAAIANEKSSPVASRTFAPNIPSDTLVWSDEFNNASVNAAPNPNAWAYDTGNSGFGNHELETYCAWGDATAPCDPVNPNAYVAPDGYLHIVARQPTPGTYTSARLKSQGIVSMSNDGPGIRMEARLKLPEAQGLWPAFWTLGSNITTAKWPACGEQDIMEHINAPLPDWIAGSLHGTHGDTTAHYTDSNEHPFSAADWHTYGMIWSKNKIAFYVDSPDNTYTTVTPADFNKPGAVWPFDSGNSVFLLLNLAVGGDWPKSPDASTSFPSEMLVDYVRVYTN
jgi:beta-glucanase (GH16 family)